MEYCRAGLCILNCQCIYLVELFPVRMRIFSAGFRTVLINTAIIVASQEGTRHWTEYILLIFIDMQMSLNNFMWFDTQCRAIRSISRSVMRGPNVRQQFPQSRQLIESNTSWWMACIVSSSSRWRFFLIDLKKVFVSFSTFLALSGRELISIKWLCFNLKGQM